METLFSTASCKCNCYLCVGSVHERCASGNCAPVSDPQSEWSAGYADGLADAEEDASKIMKEVIKILSNIGVKPGYRVTKALQVLEAWHSTR